MLVLLVLLALAAPTADGVAGARVEQAAVAVARADVACCGGEVTEGDASHPCAPGESCPSPGGCCACVSCCKRVASAPVDLRPEGREGPLSHVVLPGRRAGVEEVDAVWHPPRGWPSS